MAVMASPALEDVSVDVKSVAYPDTDAMAVDSEANGIHDALFDAPDAPSPENTAPSNDPEHSQQPTTNGDNQTAPSVMDSEPASAVTADMKSLTDGSGALAKSLTSATDAPTSDVRDEPAPESTAQSTERTSETQGTSDSILVPETQLPTSNGHLDTASPNNASRDSTHSPNGAPTRPMTELTLDTQPSPLPTAQPGTAWSTNGDLDMEDAPASGKVRPREEDDDLDAREVKRTKTEGEEDEDAKFAVPEAPASSAHANGNGVPTPQSLNGSVAPPTPAGDEQPVQTAVGFTDWPETPMTDSQTRFLLERIRNTKKIKPSIPFKEPVNPEALNIPTYRILIKHPMDLGTMEKKLKANEYPRVLNFMEDLDLIVDNSVTFNGTEHPVTQAGYNMRAYFLKGMAKLPLREETPGVARPVKKKSSGVSSKVKREPRAASAATASAKSPTAPAPVATSPQASAWPLNADGMPLIRRDSSSVNDRPKREIHRPPPKDLPYNTAKPKKKKYQQELRFCESVLSEMTKQKYARFAYPFMMPVDPVALNIPSYLKIIKKPMDFGTIEKNLKAGQYQTAKDFYNDAQLVFQNCYKFNPEGDEVNKMGKELNALFDSLWKEKSDWLAQHAPASDPQSPGSAYGSDEEEEEEEEEMDPAQAQILAIQKQIQQLNETAQSLLQQQKGTKPSAPAKKKSAKPPAPKKKNSLAVPPPPKPAKVKQRTRAPAPLTWAQKQEISEGISTLGDAEMRKAVQIIRNGCPHLADVNDDEMEIDMDEIGDDTLRELFKFIKQVRGPKGVVMDDDFEPPKPVHKPVAGKPKKNKPMGKKEQEESIRRIQAQLENFQNASGSSQSPPANQDESSEDESSGSESEEE